MKVPNPPRHWIKLTLISLLLTACASNNLSPMPTYTAPPMSGTWKDLGTINHNNIVVAYDTGSIRKNGDTAQLRDRKIIVNPAQEAYADTPPYKIAVSDWEFHCKNRSYRLASVQFLDDRGALIKRESYTPTEIRPMPLNQGTIAEKQFNVVCR